jgi:hypothetical protein
VGANLSDLIGVIKAKQAEIALSLANGGAINIESYHRLVGNYMGLAEALIMIDQLLADSEKDL